MYKLAIKENLDRKFKKLKKKDRELLVLIDRKVQEILDNPYRFKPLRKPLQNKRRVHIGMTIFIKHRDFLMNKITSHQGIKHGRREDLY